MDLFVYILIESFRKEGRKERRRDRGRKEGKEEREGLFRKVFFIKVILFV